MSKVRSGTAITLILASCAYATALSAQGLEGQATYPATVPAATGNGGTGATYNNGVAPNNATAPLPPQGAEYAPPPQPMYPPPPAMAPGYPMPPPPPTAAPAPSTPSTEPTDERPSRSGTLGFGTSLSSGTSSFPLSIGNQLNLRIWLGDVVALQPALVSTSTYVESTKVTTYQINPQMEVLFAVFRGKTNRINLGVGVGVNTRGVSKPSSTTTTITGTGGTSGNPTSTTSSNDATETQVYVPFELQLEQFLAPWFSLQIGASCDLFRYTTATSGSLSTYNIVSETSSTKLQLGLMFYTF